MKKIYFLTLILLAAVTGWSQTKTWNGPATGGSWTTGGNWSPTGAPGTNDVVLINGGVSGTITAVPSITLRGLRIEGNSTVTFTSTGDRTISVAGVGGTTSFNVESGSSLILPGGTNRIDIDFSRGTGTGNTLGAIAGSLEVGNDCSVYFDNNNTLTTVSGVIEVNGNNGDVNSTAARLNFAAGGTYIHSINNGFVPTATWAATSNCNITGFTTNIDNSSFNQTLGNVTWDCPGQTAGFSMAGNLSSIAGDFTVASTGSGDLRLKQSGGTTSTTVGGNFTLSGGTLYIVQSANTHTLSVAGNITISGGTLARGGSSTANFVFNGSSEQVYSKTGGSISGTVNFNVNSGTIVNMGTSLLDGSSGTFTLSAGAKIITANAAGLASTGASGSIRVTGTRTYDAGADYEFQGAATGTFTTTGNNVRDLIINNTSGQVSMGRNFNVTRALTLTNGYVTPGANTLLVGTAGTSTSSNGAYVNGQLSKSFNGNQAFTFYVGKTAANGLRSIGLTTNSGGGTSTFVAELLRASGGSITNGSVYGSGISRVSQCEYWTLNRSGGSRGGQVTLSWDANSPCNSSPYVTELTSLRVARHDGTAWQNAGPALGANPGSVLAVGTITSGNVTAFSPFALATSNAAENPLPVLFADVKAYGKNNGVQVEWSNLTEREIVNYEVERSANGVDFYAVNTQLPRSNRDDKASYTFFDASPVNGANFYRVRVQEQSGKVIYSKILRVEMGSTKYSFSLYPNPVTGKQLTVSLNGVKQGKYNVQIIDAAGQRVFTTNLSNVGTGVTQMIELPANVKTGMYVMVVSSDNYRETQQFIVR